MAQPKNKILTKMLDRLFAAIVNGPSLNCRPHASRQRLDLTQLAKLADASPEDVFRALVTDRHKLSLKARVPAPPLRTKADRHARSRTPGATNGSAHRDTPMAEKSEAVVPAAKSLAPEPAQGPQKLVADRETHAENAAGVVERLAPAAVSPPAPAIAPQSEVEAHEGASSDEAETPASSTPAERAWTDQQAVLNRLSTIAEDAKTYEQDTGVHVLNIGFPLLSLPPGTFGGREGLATRRVLAPIAFIPVSVVIKRGAAASVDLSAKAEGIDLITPNAALLAWLEQQTGKAAETAFADEEGTDPWREISELVRYVATTLECEVPPAFELKAAPATSTPVTTSPAPAAAPPAESIPTIPVAEAGATDEETPGNPSPVAEEGATPPLSQPLGDRAVVAVPDDLKLVPAPRAEDPDSKPSILMTGVLGLFPIANQGLLRDMKEMEKGAPLAGPVQSFVQHNVSLDRRPEPQAGEAQPVAAAPAYKTSDERLVAPADPCQARAVRLARSSSGLVVHGPPGTGKSQTITNIIGDHLVRGQRVLVVCDKRTALDVVANRLRHMGLGGFCAVVHDPQRDQRELYRTIRQQLDDLPEAPTNSKAAAGLAKIDAELQSLHDELSQYHEAIVRPEGEQGHNFHELVGQWLGLYGADDISAERSEKLSRQTNAGPAPSLDLLDAHTTDIEQILGRALECEYPTNPWTAAAGIPLNDFLARPIDILAPAMGRLVVAAQAVDATADPAIPPFVPEVDIAQQAISRESLAKTLDELVTESDLRVIAWWAKESPGNLQPARDRITAVDSFLKIVQAGAADAELEAALPEPLPNVRDVSEQLAGLAAYLDACKKWYAFALFKQKAQGGRILNRFGLPLGEQNGQRLHTFLTNLRARLMLRQLLDELGVQVAPAPLVRGLGGQAVGSAPKLAPGATLARLVLDHQKVIDLLLSVRADAAVAPLIEDVEAILLKPVGEPHFVEGLKKSLPRAEAIVAIVRAMSATRLFEGSWLARQDAGLREGSLVLQTISALNERQESLEGVLRVHDALSNLPADLRGPVQDAVGGSTPPADGIRKLRRDALAAEISRRLATNPHLQAVDAKRLQSSLERYRAASEQKRELVRDSIRALWSTRQRERLLAATGSRLSSLGADLRRRLTIRGEHAMRLRQVVAIGRQSHGADDPMFDLCPVWMCSPETVAQVFPREAIFDAVVFDEASQCRLEEALPVLLRGKRVVIAGDPKQLPPTRFFESAVAKSEDEELETDQQLFETQQGEVEDLLEAALGLDIVQCYLDVHYRSRNADLIAFSNQHFYNSRLQPIPAPPTTVNGSPTPLTVYHAGGTYLRRQNEAEAERVVEIVAQLLRRPDPPSIGIACFNLPQRDLIVEKLEERAAEEAAFARRLAKAQQREGEGSFEGLFVKNLENVQGDERDHILISTTYGPDSRGRFYRRFGPLGLAGGARRLNVLVTRAREAVHLITSIPAESFRSLPTLERGQTPGGAWLLFAYLNFAEKVAEAHQPAEAEDDKGQSPETSGNAVADSEMPETKPPVNRAPGVVTHEARSPSPFAEALAHRLMDREGISSDVHLGNAGFCIDLALRRKDDPNEVTVGLLCDAARFAAADDPIEWDAFRAAMLEAQGWRLHRVWTPHFFRDPKSVTRGLIATAEAAESGDEKLADSPAARKGR